MVFAMLLVLHPTAYASNDVVTDALYNEPANIQQIERTNQQIEEYLESKMITYATSRGNLNVPCYQQSSKNNCSVACLQMVIGYATGSTITQSTIQSYQTSTYGSEWNYVYAVTGGLNHYVGGYQYANTSNTNFSGSLITSIDNGKPVICQVTTVDLPNYTDGCIFDHYIVVKGYYAGFSGNNAVDQITYNDPHYSNDHFGTFTCTFAQMTACVNAHSGYYIRGT